MLMDRIAFQEIADDVRLTPVERLLKLPHPDGFPPNRGRRSDGWVNYNGSDGRNRALPLLSEPGVAAAKWFGAKGYEFPEHAHEQVEWVLVISGSIEVRLLRDTGEWHVQWLKVGDGFRIPPGVRHSAKFPEDCYYLAATIPGNDKWPEV